MFPASLLLTSTITFAGWSQVDFGKWIMFGFDQIVWPEKIARSIEAIEAAAFLSHEQKRDIFFNNAARFLRLAPIR